MNRKINEQTKATDLYKVPIRIIDNCITIMEDIENRLPL